MEHFNTVSNKYNKSSTITELVTLLVTSDDEKAKEDFQLNLHSLDRVLHASCSLLQNLTLWGNKEHKNTYNITIGKLLL